MWVDTHIAAFPLAAQFGLALGGSALEPSSIKGNAFPSQLVQHLQGML